MKSRAMNPQATQCGISRRVVILVLVAAVALPSVAMPPGEKVANFTLKDQHGNIHGLAGARAVASMVWGNGCPICAQRHARVRKVARRIPGQLNCAGAA